MRDAAPLMLIGILSDSHGRVEMTRRAVAALLDGGAEMLIHLGDFETEDVIDELVGTPARIVFGNCDDEVDLKRHARAMDITVDHPCGRIDAEGKSICFTHGHLGRHMTEALEAEVDYLLHGHTHRVRDERRGPTRILNPGALFRASRYTAMLLNPATDEVTVLEIPHDTAGP
ncbi:MAG: YfcE family phosphodiesterase [Phycisphaerales bacterium]|nr:MAG: YfcE family phosphodiesterase [Phycisphaerales bacterium]